MFFECTSLSNATNLIVGPYTAKIDNLACKYMFGNCTSLIRAPQLPVITLAPSCYYGMFEGCTALTTSPLLKSQGENLQTGCYQRMFSGCIALLSISAALDNWINPINNEWYTLNWVADVNTNAGYFYGSPELSGNNIKNGAHWIPTYWSKNATTIAGSSQVINPRGTVIDDNPVITIGGIGPSGSITEIITTVPTG